MAENASTKFNVHVPEFVDVIWVALRDPRLDVRERAVEALRACLRVIEKRETRWRVQWFVPYLYIIVLLGSSSGEFLNPHLMRLWVRVMSKSPKKKHLRSRFLPLIHVKILELLFPISPFSH